MKKENHAESDMRILPFMQDGEYYFHRGIKAYQKKDLDKARKLFERAVYLQPEEPAFYCQLASTLAELGEYDKSNLYLVQVLETMGQDISECYFFMANNYAHLGMFSEAETYASLYMKKDPDGEFFDDALELIDLINFETGSEALTEEEELIIGHEEARHSIEKGDLKEAKKQLAELISKHPAFWAAYNNLALTHFYLNEFEEALNVLTSILDKNPGNLNALCNLAIFYEQLGKKEEAAEMVEGMKKVYPIHPDHRYKLGSTFGIFNEHAWANRWLASINKHYYYNDPSYLHLLAVSFYALGRTERAMNCWSKAQELDPKSQVASYYLEKAQNDELTVTGADYQYRAPSYVKQENAQKRDFMQRFNNVARGLQKSKLVHLTLLRGNNSEENIETLQEFCTRDDEHTVLKEVAASLLVEMNPGTKVSIQGEDGEQIIENVSPTIASGLSILSIMKENGASIDDDVTFLWLETMILARSESSLLRNDKAIAAAIDYVSRKRKDGATQRQIAELYGITVSMLSSRIQFIKRGLERVD
ncbi:tetratricopeptide repeat protein [Fictibacillus sp. WQ 8-8]|uniref:tetratricopeptide repeat protein n=1 Tax=Fictibacillus sp. WQ 8-8 TaxID=2938788 RepID=UPI00210E596C|nr:tetratricopeptide repeat protein [Fictibacillus sp. WQ 8-8]MCQ6264292.1 tetratricopeptide repeat protein [Fictibacillus sp. WQ 8-8]